MYFICEYVYTYAYMYLISLFVARAFSLPSSPPPLTIHNPPAPPPHRRDKLAALQVTIINKVGLT
jgi:hypothetical protein